MPDVAQLFVRETATTGAAGRNQLLGGVHRSRYLLRRVVPHVCQLGARGGELTAGHDGVSSGA